MPVEALFHLESSKLSLAHHLLAHFPKFLELVVGRMSQQEKNLSVIGQNALQLLVNGVYLLVN